MNTGTPLGAWILALLLTVSGGAVQAKTPPDQLLIGMNMNNLLTLDPAAMTGNDIVGIVVNLYDPLIELDPQELTNVRPALATSWEVNDPGSDHISSARRREIPLRKPVTAEDLCCRCPDPSPESGAARYGNLTAHQKNVDEMVRTPSPGIVEFSFPNPRPETGVYSLPRWQCGALDSKPSRA